MKEYLKTDGTLKTLILFRLVDIVRRNELLIIYDASSLTAVVGKWFAHRGNFRTNIAGLFPLLFETVCYLLVKKSAVEPSGRGYNPLF